MLLNVEWQIRPAFLMTSLDTYQAAGRGYIPWP